MGLTTARRASLAATVLTLAAGCGAVEPKESGGDTSGVDMRASALAIGTGVTLWTTANSNKTIPACWMKAGQQPPGLASPKNWTTEQGNIDDAIRNTWGRVANVRFTFNSTCPTTGSTKYVRISLLGKTALAPNDCCGWDGGTTRAPFGFSTLRPPVAFDPANPTNGDSVNVVLRADGVGSTSLARMQYIGAHEFGHVLGFIHEQDRNDNNGQCPPGSTDPTANKLTSYDNNSIMNYCGPNAGVLSPLDVLGARKAYGYRNAGDFNFDQARDFLWRNSASGEIVTWAMAGAVQRTPNLQVSLGVVSTDWRLVGTGDFNNDGESDFVWFNATSHTASLWLMKRGVFQSAPAAFGLNTADGWDLRAVGDFDGDGNPDVAWQSPAAHAASMWLMQDGAVLSTPPAFHTTIAANWYIVGTGDFNGDGKDDIVWYNNVTGTGQVGFMNGNSMAGFATPFTTGISSDWSIRAVGDYNADGMPDIVWGNSISGQVALWFMSSATTVLSMPAASATVTPSWQIVGP
jgi:hypothetical protein